MLELAIVDMAPIELCEEHVLPECEWRIPLNLGRVFSSAFEAFENSREYGPDCYSVVIRIESDQPVVSFLVRSSLVEGEGGEIISTVRPGCGGFGRSYAMDWSGVIRRTIIIR